MLKKHLTPSSRYTHEPTINMADTARFTKKNPLLIQAINQPSSPFATNCTTVPGVLYLKCMAEQRYFYYRFYTSHFHQSITSKSQSNRQSKLTMMTNE